MAHLIDLFGRRLRFLRKGKGLTLEQLGRVAGLGFKHLSELERGTRVPSFDAIERLAKSLKVDAYELFLPERLDGHRDQSAKLLMRELDRHGSPQLRQFAVTVLAAARDLAGGAIR